MSVIDLIDDDSDDVAELDRRWAAVLAGEATVDNAEVTRWLRTWGTPAFKPWDEWAREGRNRFIAALALRGLFY